MYFFYQRKIYRIVIKCISDFFSQKFISVIAQQQKKCGAHNSLDNLTYIVVDLHNFHLIKFFLKKKVFYTFLNKFHFICTESFSLSRQKL
jgi:hypothetical protein